MNYGLWIVDRSIGKTSEKNNNYIIKLQIDKRKSIIRMIFQKVYNYKRLPCGCAEKVIYMPTDRIVGIRRQYNEEKNTNQTIEAYELWIMDR